MLFKTSKFKVKSSKRSSRARYKVEPGKVVQLGFDEFGGPKSKFSNCGLFSTKVILKVDGKEKCTLSQGEIKKFFEIHELEEA